MSKTVIDLGKQTTRCSWDQLAEYLPHHAQIRFLLENPDFIHYMKDPSLTLVLAASIICKQNDDSFCPPDSKLEQYRKECSEYYIWHGGEIILRDKMGVSYSIQRKTCKVIIDENLRLLPMVFQIECVLNQPSSVLYLKEADDDLKVISLLKDQLLCEKFKDTNSAVVKELIDYITGDSIREEMKNFKM